MQDEVGTEYAKVVVTKYLESHGYQDSLVSFLREADLPRRSLLQKDGESLETILDERIKFAEHSVAQSMQDMNLNDRLESVDEKYGIPSWDHAMEFKRLELHDTVKDLVVDVKFGPNQLLFSTSSKEVRMYDFDLNMFKKPFKGSKGTGLLKPCGFLGETGYFYCCGLDGSLNLFGMASDTALYTYKIHGRMVTHTDICPVGKSWFIVSSGLDNHLKVHLIELQTLQVRPWCEVKLASACTALQSCSDQGQLLVFLARNEHTHITCYQVDTVQPRSITQKYQLALNGAQFTVHAFGIRDMKLLPEQELLLVATSHIPYMRLLAVHVPRHVEGQGPFYDKVLRNMITEVPQDDYSQPLLGVLSGRSGIIVSSNSGVYAIDIRKGDSWLLEECPQKRVKCLAISNSNDMVAISYADKTVYLSSLCLKNLVVSEGSGKRLASKPHIK
ncbi:YGR117C [Zygosaccharomyces parabailii]|nr:YGR117C [Zygosaccharomyces parabailii]